MRIGKAPELWRASYDNAARSSKRAGFLKKEPLIVRNLKYKPSPRQNRLFGAGFSVVAKVSRSQRTVMNLAGARYLRGESEAIGLGKRILLQTSR